MENFHKFIFQGIKIVYPILSTFPSNLCVQDTILKMLVKVINENSPIALKAVLHAIEPQKWVLK